MEKETYQKELFEFEKPKKPSFFRFPNIFPKRNLETRFTVSLTSERVVLIAIGIIILMVVVYAAGVEKGKFLSKGKIISMEAAEKVPVVQKSTASAAGAASKPKSELQDKAVPSQPTHDFKPFTIVVATFANKDVASQETERLKKKGLDAFLRQSDSYFQVCIGAYTDKDSVQSKMALKKVREIYRDAYFKLR